jgi:hypothetical protein
VVRKWSITVVTAAVTATVLLAAGLLIDGGSGDHGAQASTETAHRAPATARPVPEAAANIGPEGVAMPGGKPLGPASSPRPGHARGGVPCGSGEQLRYHVHARLTLFVNGKPRSVPLGVGIGAPLRTQKGEGGRFASGGSCFSFLHTHAADGVIHIEAPGRVTFTLGQFFAVWNQRLDPRHLGDSRGRVVAYLNGKRWRADPRAIPLTRHAQVQLSIGTPRPKQALIRFPLGL